VQSLIKIERFQAASVPDLLFLRISKNAEKMMPIVKLPLQQMVDDESIFSDKQKAGGNSFTAPKQGKQMLFEGHTWISSIYSLWFLTLPYSVLRRRRRQGFRRPPKVYSTRDYFARQSQ
jgi:hypothetical protein